MQVVTTGKITHQDRALAWNELRKAAKEKKTRPFYRAVNKHGFMYAGKIFSSLVEICHFPADDEFNCSLHITLRITHAVASCQPNFR